MKLSGAYKSVRHKVMSAAIRTTKIQEESNRATVFHCAAASRSFTSLKLNCTSHRFCLLTVLSVVVSVMEEECTQFGLVFGGKWKSNSTKAIKKQVRKLLQLDFWSQIDVQLEANCRLHLFMMRVKSNSTALNTHLSSNVWKTRGTCESTNCQTESFSHRCLFSPLRCVRLCFTPAAFWPRETTHLCDRVVS